MRAFDPRCPRRLRVAALLLAVTVASAAAAEPDKRLLWGDTHLHTHNSFDAFLNRNMSAGPATAYRFAKGLPVIHPYHRARVQLRTPLDFLVIADHAELLGVIRTIIEDEIPKEDLGLLEVVQAYLAEYYLRGVVEDDEGMSAFRSVLPEEGSVEEAAAAGRTSPIVGADAMARAVWQEAIRIADEHNDPGSFTSLIGWEWSSIPAGANLHRVVFTSADASVASKFQPWSSIDSSYPEDLWKWLDETSESTGAEFVSIPHNSNISMGYMFGETSLRGAAITKEYAELRERWEKVVEVTQFKGDSETHPDLSPDDPFADFELYPHYIMQGAPPYRVSPGDYVRSALRRGLAIEEKIGFNPYRFGLIGSTDAHTGLATAEEPNFWGKMARDSTPETKGPRFGNTGGPTGWSMSASGLAAVWATENTRAAILAAFRAREVYATTGPRIAVRVFGGWDYEAADAEAGEVAAIGYGRGVPMGGELSGAPEGGAPRLLIHALKDADGANLDRVQVVKGWIDSAGETHERVYDVAASDGRTPDEQWRVEAVRNTVDVATASYSNEVGATSFAAVWRDPHFDPARAAFYYVRALEIPTPRHSTFDAVALGVDPEETGKPAFIQERAYTSPIWYRP